MRLDKFQRAKVVLGLGLFVLLFAILFIPNIINNGLSWISEDTIETFCLVFSFFFTVYLFWHYDYVVRKREQASFYLSSKLKNREKELLETFQYLGKVNVRFSVIRDLLDRMKRPAPTTREELKEALNELLNIVCSATSRKQAWLKIINTKNRRVLIEKIGGHNLKKDEKVNKIGVKNLLDIYNKKKNFKNDEFEIFYSELDNFYIKAFLILPANGDLANQNDDFLKAVANQCEILFLLFDSQYYRPKNKHNEK